MLKWKLAIIDSPHYPLEVKTELYFSKKIEDKNYYNTFCIPKHHNRKVLIFHKPVKIYDSVIKTILFNSEINTWLVDFFDLILF